MMGKAAQQIVKEIYNMIVLALLVICLFSCSERRRQVSATDTTIHPKTELKESEPNIPIESQTEQQHETPVEEDCIFNNDYQTLTREWLLECNIGAYSWDSLNNRAVIINDRDTIFVAKGGCDHFNIWVESKLASDSHSLGDSAYWICQSLVLAEKFHFDHYLQKIREGNVMFTQNSDYSAWFELTDANEAGNLYYPGIEIRNQNGEKRISISQYYN